MAKVTPILIGSLLFIAWGVPEQTAVPRDTLITLRRFTDAFNNGTDYKLTISADGTVIFQRIANPAVDISDLRARASEPIQTRIPVDQIALLVAEFERTRYFSLKDHYATTEDGCPNVFFDQGGAETSITMNGKTKSIFHYYGCSQEPLGAAYPLALTALEKKIDDIVGTKQWLKP